MITSLQNQTIKDIIKLKQKKYRDETGLYLVEGYHLVEEAKKHHVVKQIISTSKIDDDTLVVSDHVYQKLAFTKTPQPVMAICQKKPLDIQEGKRYLLLDRVQDPGNVGTMMRTALALGYDQMILSKDCVDLYNDKVIRASQGAIFAMPVSVMDLKQAICMLKENDVAVYGTCLENALSIDECPTYEKMAFVMGNEGQGISKDILDLCDRRLYIPIQSIESLNVAIAAAMTMYHFR